MWLKPVSFGALVLACAGAVGAALAQPDQEPADDALLRQSACGRTMTQALVPGAWTQVNHDGETRIEGGYLLVGEIRMSRGEPDKFECQVALKDGHWDVTTATLR